MGYARQFDAEIVNYADDFCVVGKTSAAQMLLAVNRIMTHLELPLNVEKTRCLRCPEQPLEFLGYRIGIDYCHRGTGSYFGTRPSKASVQIIGISVHLIGIRKVELPHSPAFGGQGRVVPPPDRHEGVSHRFSGLASDASGHPSSA